jgi:hypothetical protein
MKTASPWWTSLVFGAALLFVLLGERIFGSPSDVRPILTWVGVAFAVGVTGLRAWTTAATRGSRRNVERTLLLCHVGALLALLVYLFTTKWGISHLSLSEKAATKFETAMEVLYTILLIVSLTPMLMIEASLGVALRDGFDVHSTGEEGLEYMRVRDVGWSGLAIAFAAAFLMVTCNVASERNIQRDVSYFKTSSPGESSINIVASSPEKIRVMLWFPATNEVKEQVKGYFEALASETGKVEIEEHVQRAEETLAQKYKVTKDGMIVIVRGTGDKEKTSTIEVETDLEKARRASNTNKLRNFDREVNKELRTLIGDKRKAYLTIGHGELTDPDSLPAELKGRIPDQRTGTFRKRIVELGYEPKDLAPIDLIKGVPEDAAVVMCIGPTAGLTPAEWSSLDRYLEKKGGRLLLALDPHGEPNLGTLQGRLGVKFLNSPLTDDQSFLPQTGQISDRRWAVTSQFSSHASTTSLSRNSRGLVLIGTGALEDSQFTSTPAPTRTYTIHSMDTAFLDLNNNFSFDSGSEKRQKWHIAAAIEGPSLGKEKDKDGKDKDKPGFRAVVLADAALFVDVGTREMGGNVRPKMISELFGGQLAGDTIDWLAGKELFAGDVKSEDDQPIQHTKGQDAVWFTLTMIGAPLLVLALGLFGTLARRRRGAKKAEVQP